MRTLKWFIVIFNVVWETAAVWKTLSPGGVCEFELHCERPLNRFFLRRISKDVSLKQVFCISVLKVNISIKCELSGTFHKSLGIINFITILLMTKIGNHFLIPLNQKFYLSKFTSAMSH